MLNNIQILPFSIFYQSLISQHYISFYNAVTILSEETTKANTLKCAKVKNRI